MTGPDPVGRNRHMCESKELLVSFLYNEIDSVSKREFQKHLATCVECREELAELGATRAQIATWTPPDADLGFRIVRETESPKRRWFEFSPAWALAAAAVLLLAIGAAVANLDVRYGSDGLVVRTGWNHSTDVTPQSAAGAVAPVDWKTSAEKLERRVRELEETVASRSQSGVQNASTNATSEARVREIIAQSETRQQRLFTARLIDLTQEFDARRKLDLALIDQGMTRLQNTNGAEVRRYREYLDRMIRPVALQEK